jgi:hypothetical protein
MIIFNDKNVLTFMTTTFLKQFQNFGENLIIDALHFQLLLVFSNLASDLYFFDRCQFCKINYNIFLEKMSTGDTGIFWIFLDFFLDLFTSQAIAGSASPAGLSEILAEALVFQSELGTLKLRILVASPKVEKLQIFTTRRFPSSSLCLGRLGGV